MTMDDLDVAEAYEANRRTMETLNASYLTVRVTRTRYVQARPWKSERPTVPNDGRAYVVQFRVLNSNNGELANDLEFDGTVKWDGCSNWGNGNGCAIHMCGVEEAEEIAACLRVAYALADDLMDGDSEFERPEFTPYMSDDPAGEEAAFKFAPPEWP